MGQESQEQQPKLTRREFLRLGALLALGAAFSVGQTATAASSLPKKESVFPRLDNKKTSEIERLQAFTVYLNRMERGIPLFTPESRKEIKTAPSDWQIIGPPVAVEAGQEPDGIRATAAFQDGSLVLAATWEHGVWALARGDWFELAVPQSDEQGRPFGCNRHILMLNNNLPEYSAGLRAVMVVDQGIQVLRESEGEYQVPSWHFPPGFMLEFAQTGCLVNTGSRRRLFVGGMGGIIEVNGWENGNFQGQPVFARKKSPEEGSPSIMVRTIAASLQNPNVLIAGGWWGYSGWEKEGGRIRPGAGVWKSEDGGDSWRQVLADVNVNSVFFHPQNENIIIAGTEGAGDDVTRNPNPDYPSLFISLDGGKSWRPLMPQPWFYDLVTSQQAFVYLEEQQQELLISCWAGPVMSVDFPPNLSADQLDSLGWRTLTPFDPDDPNWRGGFYGGHLWTSQGENRQFIIGTGSFAHWERPIPPFTPLRECLLPEEDPRRIFLPSVGRGTS